MQRYFIEVAYRGENYSGFQVQENAHTVQAELEKALQTFFRRPFFLTGSSRTDSGVHALQNFFHFDDALMPEKPEGTVYHINAILPADIAVKGIYRVEAEAHCRFDAVSRFYRYRIYREKNPFLTGQAYFFPYKPDVRAMQAAAAVVMQYSQFESFSKKSTQVHSYECNITRSEWIETSEEIWYQVEGNRFLRGMVRGLVGTMLKVGTGRMRVEQFEELLRGRVQASADFSVPGHGLYLVRVSYPERGIFKTL